MTQKNPSKTYVQGGGNTLESYKKMINGLCIALTGEEAEFTEEEWQKNFEEYQEAGEKKQDPDPGK
jgi:hypothetical protein